MSKELKALRRIKKNLTRYDDIDDEEYLYCQDEIDLDTIETALKKQEQDQKKLKTLEIIIEKRVDVALICQSSCVEDYNNSNRYYKLSQTEFETIKRCCYEREDKNNLYGVGITDREFSHFIIKELLGEDWCVADPLGHNQINEIAFYRILELYSPKKEH